MSPSRFSPLIYSQPLNRVNNSQNQRFLHKQPIDFNLIDSILLPHHRLKLFILISGDSDYLKKFYSRLLMRCYACLVRVNGDTSLIIKRLPHLKMIVLIFFCVAGSVGLGLEWIGLESKNRVDYTGGRACWPPTQCYSVCASIATFFVPVPLPPSIISLGLSLSLSIHWPQLHTHSP